MKQNDVIYHETARMQVYRLLSKLFELPDQGPDIGMEKHVRQLDRHLNTLDLNPGTHSNLTESYHGRQNEPKDLAIEYSRLFVGPYRLLAPPYGSVYLDPERKVMGNSTFDVQQRYARFGIEVAEDFMDTPDHITAELEFMYFLVFKEIEILNSGQPEQVYEILIEQQSFVKEHLNAWVPQFSDLITEHSKTLFYRCLAETTQKYIAWDLSYLGQIPAMETQD